MWRFCEEFVILEFGTCDLANGTDALSVADAVMNVAHRIIDDFGVRHVTVCSVLHRTYLHDINKKLMRITMYYATFVMWKAISITTPIGVFGVKVATKGVLAKYSLK